MKKTTHYPGMPNEANPFPLISLVIPFEAKMHRQDALFDLLTSAADKAEKELASKYAEERVRPVIIKLRHLIAGIHCSKDKKSLCILVTLTIEKIYYFTPTKILSNQFPPSLK